MGEDFNSPAFEAAVAMHEMYATLVQAGFTEKQGLYIIAELFKGVIQGQQP